jgi:adenine-specific DNA glycosylase
LDTPYHGRIESEPVIPKIKGMNIKNTVLILVISLLFAQSAKAAEWELFAEYNEQQYYVDKKSIEHGEMTCSWCIRCSLCPVNFCLSNLPQNTMRVWTRKIPKHAAKYQAVEELDFEEYACEKRMSRLLHATKIYSDGTGDSVNLNVVMKWEDISSDTMKGLLHAYLCNRI